MAEGDGLGGLQMRKAGHDGGGMFQRLLRQRLLQSGQGQFQVPRRFAYIKPKIHRHLIIARTRRVQTPGSRPDEILQARFHVHMDIFQSPRELEFARPDFHLDLIKSFQDGTCILFGNDALGGQHAGMGFRAQNVLGEKFLVKADGSVDFFHDLGRSGLKPPTPHLVGHLNAPRTVLEKVE